MSGRRFVDVVRIAKPFKLVASRHAAFRRRHFYLYQKPFLLWTSFGSESNGPSFFYSTGSTYNPVRDATIPSRTSVEGNANTQPQNALPEQDHFYERLNENSTANPLPRSDMPVKQESAEQDPLPDGTIPPISRSDPASPRSQASGTRPVTSSQPSTTNIEQAERARQAQRQAESQIPSYEAGPPQAIHSHVNSVEPSDPNLHVQQEQDIFYSRPSNAGPVLSSLPRLKVPKSSADVQESNEHVSDGGINQEVFYSSGPGSPENPLPHAQPGARRDDLSGEMYSELFHSRKVAHMLQRKVKSSSSQDGLKVQRPKEEPLNSIRERNAIDQGFSTGKPVNTPAERVKTSQDDETAKLVDDITNDVQKTSRQIPTTQRIASKGIEVPHRMQESRVPSSQIGRLWQYGGLATSMAFGAVSEGFRRAIIGASSSEGGSLMLSGGNMERLVSKLSRMRGAALKLGQMLSFQDSKMLPAQIHDVLQRVQDRADYMPASQRNKVLSENLGSDWRDLFSSFEEMPMAAASIGQVHGAVLKKDGMRVAIKIQYPGVASSIDSDLNNLSVLLTASRLLPKGLYLDKTIANARTELAWECDYLREAEAAKRFKHLLADETPIFQVPDIIDFASTAQVLTMERLEGIAVTKVRTLTQEQKNWIGTQILRLCLREITEFRYMQTDPNWTNFLYNLETAKLELLDFGASRDYPNNFIDPYIKILRAASQDDRDACRNLSIQLGYLTGHESKAMVDAHVASIMTLAEPFRHDSPEIYDFRNQTITDRIRGLIPLMIRERLAPPPEETYSLHRKLSGAFLLCAKLGSRVRCREIFSAAMRRVALH